MQQSLSNRADQMEDGIDDLENRNSEIFQLQENKGEEKEKEIQSLFKEILTENFQTLRRNWTYKSTKLTEHLLPQSKKTSKTHDSGTVKINDKKKNLKVRQRVEKK